MTFLKNRRAILIGAILVIAILAGLQVYFYLQKEMAIQDIQDKEAVQIPSGGQETAEVIETEIATCSNEVYIFDTVMLDDGFYNDIYKTNRLSEHFIVRIKAPRGSGGVFSVLAVPKKDCDRIYLTTAIQESDAQYGFIFEWKVDEKVVHELAVSAEFRGMYVPWPHNGKNIISPDGGKMIIAQLDKSINGEQCYLRTLRLINLREDISKVLVQLPKTEAVSNSGEFDDLGFCGNLNFGWQDESTIYYDIYSVTTGWNRPFIERRILNIDKIK